jgi:hypothetical protein
LSIFGHKVIVKSRGSGLIEVTQGSNVASRVFSLDLKDLNNHTNAYVGPFDSDVPYQHFQRLREHVTTIDNPDLIFLTTLFTEPLGGIGSLQGEDGLNKSKRRVLASDRIIKD